MEAFHAFIGGTVQNRIIELSENPTQLRIRNSLLEIHRDSELQASIPIKEVAVLIAAHPRVTFTQSVLGELSSAGGVFVTCNKSRLPIGMMLPLDGFHQQVRRFRCQAAAKQALQNRCWQKVVRAKISGQANTLCFIHGSDAGLKKLVPLVKSGDRSNVEARAARRYWSVLFGRQFRRDRDACDENMWLNYGYSVMRAIVARAICGSGLHPGLGLHHHHRGSGFPLADDLMEPFRPVVDRVVYEACNPATTDQVADTKLRQSIVGALTSRYLVTDESRTLFDWASRLSASLANRYECPDSEFEVPTF